jgi:hypothetical protein
MSAGTDPESLLLGQTAHLEVRQSEHEEPRNARQLPAIGRQPRSLPVPLDKCDAEEILQLFDLSAVLALPYGVAIGGLHDAPGGSDFQQCFQAIERQPAFSKEF